MYVKKRSANRYYIVSVYVDGLLVNGTLTDLVDLYFLNIVSLEILYLDVLNKFRGLHITLDAEFGYVLE